MDITLDYPGEITVGKTIFNHVNATVHIGNATTFSSTKFGASKIVMTESLGSKNNPYQIYSADDLEKYLTDSQYTGKYIKLYDDITLNETDDLLYHFGKDTVLDLNGHTVTLKNSALSVDNALTVEDSMGSGEITSDYIKTVIVSGTESIFILEFGGIKNTSSEDNSTAVDNYGTAVINNGWIGGTHSLVNNDTSAKVMINGGMIDGILSGEVGIISITGGRFVFDPSEYVDSQHKVIKVLEHYGVFDLSVEESGYAPETIGGNDEENNNAANSSVSNSTPKTGDTTSAAVLIFLFGSLGAVITLAKKRNFIVKKRKICFLRLF